MGRPPNPLLSPSIITTAALALIEDGGGFTIPQLAKKLNVSPSSLYNHVAGRDEIVELLRSRAMSEVTIPHAGTDSDQPWYDIVAGIAREYRRSYARYPRLIPLLTAQAVNSSQAFQMYNALAEVFAGAGFDPSETLRAITVLDSFVLGSALDLAAPEAPWHDNDEVNSALRAALQTSSPKPGRADDAFEYGLDALLSGFARR